MKKIWCDSIEETTVEDILTRKVDNGGDVIAFVCWQLFIGLNCLNFDTLVLELI